MYHSKFHLMQSIAQEGDPLRLSERIDCIVEFGMNSTDQVRAALEGVLDSFYVQFESALQRFGSREFSLSRSGEILMSGAVLTPEECKQRAAEFAAIICDIVKDEAACEVAKTLHTLVAEIVDGPYLTVGAALRALDCAFAHQCRGVECVMELPLAEAVVVLKTHAPALAESLLKGSPQEGIHRLCLTSIFQRRPQVAVVMILNALVTLGRELVAKVHQSVSREALV